MKFSKTMFLAIAVFAINLFAQTTPAEAAKTSETCEVLISVQPGGNLSQMRQASPKIEPKSCDEWLKGEVSFDQKEYPNGPTMWLNSATIKWGDAIFGRKLAVYTSKESGRVFNYNGKIEKNTPEEFLFTGKDSSMGVDAKFHVKRNPAGQITYALYEFDSRVSGVFRIGKE